MPAQPPNILISAPFCPLIRDEIEAFRGAKCAFFGIPPSVRHLISGQKSHKTKCMQRPHSRRPAQIQNPFRWLSRYDRSSETPEGKGPLLENDWAGAASNRLPYVMNSNKKIKTNESTTSVDLLCAAVVTQTCVYVSHSLPTPR